MKSKWLKKKIDYDGTQLRSLFAYLDFGLLGDSIVGFRGACDVSFEHMVDGEDLKERALIRGSDMVHFIIEKHQGSILAAVALQRLLTTIVRDVLCEMKPKLRSDLTRDGDDLYWKKTRKLSISIATVSPVSALIHFAVNVSNDGTPVKTAALNDFGVRPEVFTQKVLKAFSLECASIQDATQKVFWVK